MKKTAHAIWDKSFIRFVVIGVINTVIDFSILNTLVFGLSAPTLPANIVSASIAMAFSFYANQKVVFVASHQRSQLVKFLVVTLAGIYIIQNVIIYILTEQWLWPAVFTGDILNNLLPGLTIEREALSVNMAKVIATGATVIWNFLLYRNYVFMKTEESTDE